MDMVPTNYSSPAAVAAAETAKAEIQAAFVMATHRPRDYEKARQNILRLCEKPGFAEAVEYSKPVGGGKITGLSVRFAEQALREWGNVRTTQRVTYEDDNVRRIQVKVLDLESNAEFSREISVSKTVERKNGKGRDIVSERTNSYGDKVFVVVATDEEVAIKEASAVAKVIRNEGLRLLPPDIKDDAIEIARKTLAAGITRDPDAAKRKVIDGFSRVGVSVAMLEKYVGHPLSHLVPAEIEDLRKVYRAISEGEAKWSDFVIDIEKTSPAFDLSVFDSAVRSSGLDPDAVAGFISESARVTGKTIEELKSAAGSNFAAFTASFKEWQSGQTAKPAGETRPGFIFCPAKETETDMNI